MPVRVASAGEAQLLKPKNTDNSDPVRAWPPAPWRDWPEKSVRKQWPKPTILDYSTLFVTIGTIGVTWLVPFIRICFPNIHDPLEIFVEQLGFVTFMLAIFGHIIGPILSLICIRSVYGKISTALMVVSLVVVYNNLKGHDAG